MQRLHPVQWYPCLFLISKIISQIPQLKLLRKMQYLYHFSSSVPCAPATYLRSPSCTPFWAVQHYNHYYLICLVHFSARGTSWDCIQLSHCSACLPPLCEETFEDIMLCKLQNNTSFALLCILIGLFSNSWLT